MTATKDQVAQIIVGEAQTRKHTRDECLAEMSALYQESDWDEEIWDPTHTTYGVAQQDGSYPNRFDGAAAQVKAFFDKLDVKRADPGHGDIWLNICWLQQAPNWPSAQYWWDHGRQAYLTEIQSRIATVTPYLDKFWPITGGTPVSPPTTPPAAQDPRLTALQAVRPDFNEYWVQSDNSQDRGGAKVDLFLLHTQEGNGNADDLAHFLVNSANTGNPVSYHYTISWNAADGGVTVCDVVDTDLASWSVGNSNDRSINACFAGSFAGWTHQEWLDNVGRAIDVAAYLAVQDCIKYGITPNVIAGPNYNAPPPGISDHRYCTDYLKDGNNHQDVGDGFPWDVFAAAVAKYYAAANVAPPTPAPPNGPPTPPAPAEDLFKASDAAQQSEILAQTRGRWGRLGKNADGLDRTLVEAVGVLVDKAEGTDNSKNGDFSW